MKLIKKISIILALGMALSGCSQNVNVSTPQENQMPVIETSPQDDTEKEVIEQKEELLKENTEQVQNKGDQEEKKEEEIGKEMAIKINQLDAYEVPVGYDQPRISVQYGKLTEVAYYSTTTETTRKAKVLLPFGYSEEKTYPVLYLLHGIGGDQNEWLYGKPEQVIGNLISEGAAKEMIVVFPNVRARANDAGNPSDIFSLPHFQAFDNFINDLSNDLMPYIEANYSIQTGRENTAIAGLSMGGRESLYIGFSMPETFGYIGAFCPAFGIFGYSNNNVTEQGLFTEETFTLPKDLETLVMIVKGKSDGVVGNEPVRHHDVLVKNEVPHIYYETAGGHDFTVWNHGLYQFAKRLFKDASEWGSEVYTD